MTGLTVAEARKQVYRRLLVLYVLVGLLFAYALVQSYDQRMGQWKATSAGCERSKLDRAVNARSWRASAVSDQAIADDPTQSALTRAARGNSAAVHRIDAASLEMRARIRCVDAFPKPSLLSF